MKFNSHNKYIKIRYTVPPGGTTTVADVSGATAGQESSEKQDRVNAGSTGASTPGKRTPGTKAPSTDFESNDKKASGFVNSANQWTSLAGSAIDLGNSAITSFKTNGADDTNFAGQQAIGDTLIKSGNPYAAIAGVAYKALSSVAEATNSNLSKLDSNQAERAGVTGAGKFANNLLSYIPITGAGSSTHSAARSQEMDKMTAAYTGTANDIDAAVSMGGKKYVNRATINSFIDEQNYRMNTINDISRINTLRRNSTYGTDLLSQNQSRYSGETFQNTSIGKKGMKLMSKQEARAILTKYKSGGKNLKKADLYSLLAQFDYIITGDKSNMVFHDINKLNTDLNKDGVNNSDLARLAVNISFNEDFTGAVQELQQEFMLQSKDLTKKFSSNPEILNVFNPLTNQELSSLPKEEVIKSILPARELVAKILNVPSLVGSFQNGGVIGIDTNILPEGALHRELNDLDDINPEIGEEVTKKGIPVIVTDKDGNIDQVAEIEKEEIILRKELTTKIEALWKDGSEEAMIEAGKLLAEEIITNTQDNTGQLED